MAIGLKDLAQEFVGKEKVDDFALWAFGEDYVDFKDMITFADAWNQRHSHLLKIDHSSPIVYDMIKMTELWSDHVRSV